MKNILIVSDSIQEINKLRRYFGEDFKVSATNSIENAAVILQKKTAEIALYHIGVNLAGFFEFYKNLRTNKATEELPLIVIADTSILKTLTDTVALKKGSFISPGITPDNLQNLVYSVLDENNA
ncbi:MAG: hypothetical protein FWG44_00385 [Oscillospiraceae bacterium]|nr:hypothetical protein [Oscillospiraceae bacterium]